VLRFYDRGVKELKFSPSGHLLLSLGDPEIESSIVLWKIESSDIIAAGETPSKCFTAEWAPKFSSNAEFFTMSAMSLHKWMLDNTNQLLVRDIEVDSSLFGKLNAHDERPVEYTGLKVVTIDNSTIAWISSNKGSMVALHVENDHIPILALPNIHSSPISHFEWHNKILISSSGIEVKQGRLNYTNSISEASYTVLNVNHFDGEVVSIDFEEYGNEGLVGTKSGSIWYVNWSKKKCIRLVTSHTRDINGIAVSERIGVIATASSDKSLRLWSAEQENNTSLSLHHAIQFQVKSAEATSVVLAPLSLSCIAGYSDGSIIVFDLGKGKAVTPLSLASHKAKITHLLISHDGSYNSFLLNMPSY